jgi:hypothetical protein
MTETLDRDKLYVMYTCQYTIYFHCSDLGATIYTPLSFTTCFGRTRSSSGNDVSLDRYTVLVLLGSIKFKFNKMLLKITHFFVKIVYAKHQM